MRPLALAAAALAVVVVAPRPATAQNCRTVEVEMTPSDDLQIVVWLEDAAGNYIDTLFITSVTGSHGLGNRPGRFDFNSSPLLWPYGHRITTFPVWAHRHGMVFPEVVFQDGDKDDLSHPLNHSSEEKFYCRPIRENEALWDAMTCASVVFTDKGALSSTTTSNYPPRSDLAFDEDRDHPTATRHAGLNPYDAVSSATPPGGGLYTVRWPMPPGLPEGDYVVFVETSKQFDQNASHAYPAPVGIPWSDYGLPYLGQPSVLYSTPVTVTAGEMESMATDYVGYGAPDGADGAIRPPDVTIATGSPGTGASRLLLTVDGADMFRIRGRTKVDSDEVGPGSPRQMEATDATSTSATIRFIAPGDDGDIGTVSGYEIRYFAGQPVTAENFADATPFARQVLPVLAGAVQTFDIEGLIPQTNYYVGIRALDDCLNKSPLETVSFTTAALESGEVDYCFVATAAYGSIFASEVSTLRAFRDNALRGHVAGELAVAAYYTFGPAFAKLIAPSPTARELARAALMPIAQAVKRLVRRLPGGHR